MTQFLNNYALSLVVAIGLIVLTALNDVPSNVSVPILAGLAGVHLGNQLSSTPTVPPGESPAAAGGSPDLHVTP